MCWALKHAGHTVTGMPFVLSTGVQFVPYFFCYNVDMNESQEILDDAETVTIIIKSTVKEVVKGGKYDAKFEEPINQGKEYKEYVRDGK
jgi:hypothetical protein